MGFVCTDPVSRDTHRQGGAITEITLSVRVAIICTLLSVVTAAQGLTGALIGTVRDAQGGVLPGARVRVSSPALIGGPMTLATDEKGQLRFPALPPGPDALDIEQGGFASFHEDDLLIGAGATIDRTVSSMSPALPIGRRRGGGLPDRRARPRFRDTLRS